MKSAVINIDECMTLQLQLFDVQCTRPNPNRMCLVVAIVFAFSHIIFAYIHGNITSIAYRESASQNYLDHSNSFERFNVQDVSVGSANMQLHFGAFFYLQSMEIKRGLIVCSWCYTHFYLPCLYAVLHVLMQYGFCMNKFLQIYGERAKNINHHVY